MGYRVWYGGHATDPVHGVLQHLSDAVISARVADTTELIQTAQLQPGLASVMQSFGSVVDGQVTTFNQDVQQALSCSALHAAAVEMKDAACCGVLYVMMR